MTCIAGLVHRGRVWMGGDSLIGTGGYSADTLTSPKVFTVGAFLIGYSGTYRGAQLVQYRLNPPELPAPGCDLTGYMVTAFVDALRECLKAGGFATTEDGRESGGLYMVGAGGRLFLIHEGYSVKESADGYDALGSGEEFAKGALFATPGLPPRERIELALRAAERHNSGVRGPFTILRDGPTGADPPPGG